MRIAVTGATGFIGGHTVRRLRGAGHAVLAIGRRPTAPSTTDGTTYRRWDLREPADPTLFDGCDVVVHAAAHVDDWGPAPAFEAITVGGTSRLLDAIPSGTRLVVIGTASVYDPRVPHPLARETDGPVAWDRYLNEYARAKARQEALVTGRRPDATILRPHAVYGRGDRMLIPRLLASSRRGLLPLPGGGRHPLSVTHVETVLDAIEAAVRTPAVQGPVNVADATPVTARDLVALLFQRAGRPIRIVSVPGPVAGVTAAVLETAWRSFGRTAPPPVTRYAVSRLRGPFVLDLSRLHRELEVRPDRDPFRAIADGDIDLAPSGPATRA